MLLVYLIIIQLKPSVLVFKRNLLSTHTHVGISQTADFPKAYLPLTLLTGGAGELLATDTCIDSPVRITLRSLGAATAVSPLLAEM
jgi:hypothetical protein